MLKGKTIILGVTGSIAAYKMANVASMLVKQHADVHVIMTRNACNFITPTTFETLTGNKCLVDTFDRNFEFQVEHVSLAKAADLFLVAPATANIIGKIANGICDDMLTTTLFATRAPKLIAPAMNTNMWENPILQDNIRKITTLYSATSSRTTHQGFTFITPDAGRLACGDTGAGKLPSEDVLMEHIMAQIAMPHDLKGKRVLVSAGPTQEAIDPVRFISNHSSGKMGYAVAKMACLRGAEVTLVSGPVSIKPFLGINVIPAVSAGDMFNAVTSHADDSDIIIMCSAVADYTPTIHYDQKVKKKDDDMSVPLTRTQDILKYLGEHRREGQILVGFSMETENMLENSRTKLTKKNVDMICANSLSSEGTGFQSDTNRVTVITKGNTKQLPFCSKEETANMIIDEIVQLSSAN